MLVKVYALIEKSNLIKIIKEQHKINKNFWSSTIIMFNTGNTSKYPKDMYKYLTLEIICSNMKNIILL